VLSSTEDECTVFAEGRCDVLAYARPFPAPRADRVTPGNLVAIAAAGGIGSSSGAGSMPWCWTGQTG
jgi:hypothetical protein